MFELNIVTPKGMYQKLDVVSVNVLSTDGRITTLSNHMDVIVPVDIGVLKIESENETLRYATSAGMLTFKDNRAVLFTDTIEHEDEIDFMRAEAAKERALRRIERRESVQELERGELALKRSLARLSLQNK